MRLRLRYLAPGALAVFALASAPGVAHGQQIAQATALYKEASELQVAGRLVEAERKCRMAEKLWSAPLTWLCTARVLREQKRYVEAHSIFYRVANEDPNQYPDNPNRVSISEGKRHYTEVSRLLAYATVLVVDASGKAITGLTIKVNDKAVKRDEAEIGIALDPGTHLITVAAPGYLLGQDKLTASEGQRQELKIVLKPDPTYRPPQDAGAATTDAGAAQPAGDGGPLDLDGGSSPPPSKGLPVGSWISFGLGVAGLGVGAATGILALGKKNELANACPGGKCVQGSEGERVYNSAYSTYTTMGTISTIGFIVGGVGVATGFIWWLASPSKSEAPRATVYVGPGEFGVAGRF